LSELTLGKGMLMNDLNLSVATINSNEGLRFPKTMLLPVYREVTFDIGLADLKIKMQPDWSLEKKLLLTSLDLIVTNLAISKIFARILWHRKFFEIVKNNCYGILR
jgi:hypothetical protein